MSVPLAPLAAKNLFNSFYVVAVPKLFDLLCCDCGIPATVEVTLFDDRGKELDFIVSCPTEIALNFDAIADLFI